MLRFFRRNLLAGVLAITPVVLTVWVMWRLYDLIAGMLRPALSRLPFIHDHYPEFLITLAGLVALVPVLVLLGLFTRNLVGKAFFEFLDRVFDRIPLVKGLFTTFKQIAGVFGPEQARTFQRVVLVTFPGPGSEAIAFVTRDEPGSDLVAVFLPTTPNPTTGFLLVVARDRVRPVALTVEEAAKLIVSGGAIMSSAQVTAMRLPDDGAKP